MMGSEETRPQEGGQTVPDVREDITDEMEQPRLDVLPADGAVRVLPLDEDDELGLGPRLPSAQQVAAALAMLALVSPAALGGMPVLPVTIDEERRRHQDEIQQQSASSVGIYQDAREAETALTLSQRRLAQATREVEHSTSRNVTETDVVDAAHRVFAGEVSPHQSIRFRSALTSVATDSVDLFILSTDEERMRAAETQGAAETPEDLEAWLEEFA